jgi:hypothetical protein
LADARNRNTGIKRHERVKDLMPTPNQAFAAVAEALAGIDPRDQEAVTGFYRRNFVAYPLPVRALITDFLTGQTGTPSDAALDAPRQAVRLPVDDVPGIEAPIWDETFGPALDHVADERQKIGVAG